VDEALARERPVFTVDGDVYRWDDVVRFAKLRGDWDAILADVAAGLSARGDAVGPDEIDEAARSFRRERRLLAADELAEWLDRRGLTADEWLAYLRRTLARERVRDVGAALPADVDDYSWAEAICSGRLEELARTLAKLVAVAPTVPFGELDAAYEEFALGAATEDAVAREIATARMDWIRIRYAAALFGDEEAAAEAVLCVHEDGQPFADVAETAGVAIEEHDVWLEEADPALAPRLVAARPGELVAPLETSDGVLVAEVLEKMPVRQDDPLVRARAAAVVAERTASRLVTDRVVWNEQL